MSKIIKFRDPKRDWTVEKICKNCEHNNNNYKPSDLEEYKKLFGHEWKLDYARCTIDDYHEICDKFSPPLKKEFYEESMKALEECFKSVKRI